MPLMHGFFSLGTVIGAVVGMLLTAAVFPVVWHLIIVAVIVASVLLVAIRDIPAGYGRRATNAGERGAPRAVWKDPRLLFVGAIILALAMAEGTANDWLPLVMVDGHGFGAAVGSAIYAIFAAAMTVGRFVGGWFVDRFGRAAVLAGSALFGALGLAVVIFVDSQIAAAAGGALGHRHVARIPGRDVGGRRFRRPSETAARVSFAATIGYVAFLVGPPVLGLLGEQFGLRAAMIFVLILVTAAMFLAPAARTQAERKPLRG